MSKQILQATVIVISLLGSAWEASADCPKATTAAECAKQKPSPGQYYLCNGQGFDQAVCVWQEQPKDASSDNNDSSVWSCATGCGGKYTGK
ncbi:MAG: hypothetical protein ACD_16C00205G0002 [uncultured bacterium]|nr:MAG: hypothetical protein ACD_16C00205G0002 [uncultured bacterium]OFW68742.1 MAG: hypothetical protein A2X70_04500 [Alphaproteobacteria bacterium GWC2_42_16]OFW73248.1 MAG: hypothetical protein A2Z80_03675 [Alphaproteobacteria bacterium GWA2_41_27]OFW81918.1 MAG: hypothetical protein A3E50_07365 [Alphaproteobacteria bacterium RIFCSPHIGHO2_12_FULL_42_100]OFW84910.1 MAG: hypothetical protein A2W06_03565 [Alphaproteobacteria bacterium RBG_16_42_14]OFW91029.1 MAG: hypothetical protein A3C41_043